MASKQRINIAQAQAAHTDLNALGAIIAILEGGVIYTRTGARYADRIIKLCKEANQKLLKQMDDAVERAGGGRYGD